MSTEQILENFSAALMDDRLEDLVPFGHSCELLNSVVVQDIFRLLQQDASFDPSAVVEAMGFFLYGVFQTWEMPSRSLGDWLVILGELAEAAIHNGNDQGRYQLFVAMAILCQKLETGADRQALEKIMLGLAPVKNDYYSEQIAEIMRKTLEHE